MKKLNIDLPRYHLFLQFRLTKRRENTVSKFFRHIFEHKKINRALASGLSLAIITTSYFPPSDTAQAQELADEVMIATEVNLATEKSVQYPVSPVRITQRFAFYHPGVDFDGLTGDAVRSIKSGKVTDVSYSKFAYGNSVRIEHSNNVSSLYAHLSKIEVEKDQEVTMDTEIGKVGATGRAFGDHLHLEVYDHGRTINPLTVLR